MHIFLTVHLYQNEELGSPPVHERRPSAHVTRVACGVFEGAVLAYPLETERAETPNPDVTLVRGGKKVRLGQRKGCDSPLVLSERADLCVPKGGLGDVPHLLAHIHT